MQACGVMQVLQYHLAAAAQQSRLPPPDISQQYAAPPPYFAALPNAAGAPVADGVLTCARRRKYAWWCVGCGALAAALGGLLAAAHILLRAYTASPHHLETVPAAVPAAMLVLTGVCIMSLARRRNRYSYMIKVVGACCLVCALTCVLVTITTTVIHMNKLQTLKFCEYTKLTRTCTCFSLPPDSHHSSEEDEGVRCVFEGVTDCGVVHGVLYWCLRGVFALSVTAVLVCIFSSMLAYQLLSHERKKMYWEQLELRCRSLYRPPSGVQPRARPMQPPCGCCQQCHPAQPAWDISLQHRFWAPGRIGNLYSPNPGTVRKTSAWSWFPWPRSNSQRCRMGAVPQSGDSAYGFCDTSGENPTQTSSNPNPTTPYEDRPSYPSGFNQNNPTFNQNSLQFASSAFDGAMSQSTANFGQNSGTFGQSSAGFVQSAAGFGQSAAGYEQEGQFGEGNGSFDVQNGVWGPPPPYSPQGRGGSRHHLHQDPAATTLLHHHHVEMHRNSMPVHNHAHTMGSSMAIQHTCSTGRNSSYMGHLIHPNAAITADISQMAPELVRLNPELARFNPELARMNPELSRLNPELARLNPELARLNPELARLNPELVRLNPEMARFNQELHSEMGFGSEMVRLGSEMSRLASDGRCNTLRGHLVPYNGCQRMMGVSMGNLHRECGSEGMPMECLHQKNSNDQNVDSASKQGKENLAFQNDKHSPVRSSLQLECRGNPHTESEVYFADVSSCCNISVKADCCVSSNVSALVGTIENHPESTSGESDNGSFTLTRQQRPQPQTLGSKRRQRLPPSNEKARVNELNNSIRSLGQSERCQNERRQNCHDLNNSIRSMGQNDQRNGQSDISFRSIGQCDLRNAQNDRTLDDLNASVRSGQIDLNNSMRHELNSLRQSEHSSPIRMCSQNDHGSPMHSVHHERRMSDQNSNSSLMEDSRSRGSPKFKPNLSGLRARHDRSQNESFEQRISQNDSRISQIEPRIGQIDSRISQCDPRMGQCDPRIGQCDLRMAQSDPRIGQCDLRINHCDTRIGQCDPKIGQCDQRVDQNDQHIGQCDPRIGQSDPRIGQCDQRIGQSNPRMVQSDARFDHRSPKCDSPLHPRQSSSDSTASHKNPEFFVPPPPSHSPLSPATEESLISDEELERSAEVFKKTEKVLLGPDSQYDQREEIKPNHHHCYSDTNTMDSGWQSGSEKHVTD